MIAEKGFSFKYNGQKFDQNNAKNGKISIDNKLTVKTAERNFPEYGTSYWYNCFEANEKTEAITELNDIDIFIRFDKPYEHPPLGYRISKTLTTLTSFRGSNCGENDYAPVTREIRPGDRIELQPMGGRSSSGTMPYFDIDCNGSGAIVAIGWTGQWKCMIECTDEGVHFTAGISDADFYLEKGERIRTASCMVTEYSNGNADGHNLFKRALKEMCVMGKGERPKYPHVSAMTWGAMKTKTMLEHIEGFNKLDIGIECFWIDAGWYGNSRMYCKNEHDGDWWDHTGSWNVNPLSHPDGLRDVSQAVHESGMALLLWSEPERVFRNSDWHKEHPEYIIDIGRDNLMLNIGIDGARELVYNMLAEKISELDVQCYRQDFNFDPLEYWRANDIEGRRGITEIKYINNMYKLWDDLLSAFPKLYIDNCASGGRRNDIEMLQRSVSLWRSDYQCSFDVISDYSQAQNTGASLLMPYSACGINGDMNDTYEFRSCYGSGIEFHNWWWEEDNPVVYKDGIENVKRLIKEYKEIRPLFSEDFYPLTEYSKSFKDWCVWQYNSPEMKKGCIIAFRRKESAVSSMTLELSGINADAEYSIKSFETGEEYKELGSKLQKEGMIIALPEKRSSTVIVYEIK